MTDLPLDRNLGLDLVRTTEAAAVAAGRWMGLGRRDEADDDAAAAMARALDLLAIDGTVVIGEEWRAVGVTRLASGQHVGRGGGPQLDVVLDPIDGRTMLAQGRTDAIAVAALAPRGSMWSPGPAAYLEKLVVNRTVAPALVPECMDAPTAWTLALIARAKQKAVRDLTVFVLDRPRHADLIDEIRRAGARVMLRTDGDIAGALLAASIDSGIDVLLGIGGAAEGVIAACAVKALRGAMLVRLAPQSAAERELVRAAGLDTRRILRDDELVRSRHVFFAATGIADGPLLRGVRYQAGYALTNSLILRGETGTRRLIQAEHALERIE
jgi:fructose-1,6-bisphosphatase II